MPDFRDYAHQGRQARDRSTAENTRPLGRVPARHHAAEHDELPRLRPGREHLEQARRDLRGEQEAVARRLPPRGRRRRRAVARRPRPRDALRAHAGRLARRLPAHRPARLLLAPTRPSSTSSTRCSTSTPSGWPSATSCPGGRRSRRSTCSSPRPSGGRTTTASRTRIPGFLDVVREQEPGRVPHLPAAGRELAALRRRPLPAEHRLHQRDRLRQAEAPAVPDHGRGHRALHQGHRHLAQGEQRPGRRAGRGDGLRRRHPHQGGAGGRGAAARGLPRPEDPLRQRRRPVQAHAVDASTRTACPTATSTACSPSTSRSSSTSTAIRG